MVFNTMPAVEARQPGLLDHGFEVPVLRVLQNVGQIAAFPILVIRLIRPLDPLERRQMGGFLDL